ncbi:DUF3027 domain-containing protein [Nocardia sp. NPDC024068]|uniref:DUF3027 domain-containing protein n=1 Tax=Nocardia sp. NPDC024068 TaxID=3157197 RepID=UPI0033C0B208
MSAVSVSDTEVRTILAGAVDLARRALLDLEPTGVGPHLGVRAEDECAATHRFAATLPGYHGWQWAVVVAAAPDTDRVTVSESALLPGPDALIAPDFVPWEQRVRPGDLAPGDLLAPPADDPRLVPGYTATGDPVVDEVACQVGLGRKQVLSPEGRADAAERWYAEHGPDAEMAKAAPATCETCGFYVPLAGALRAAFGVCANVMGADGRVVHTGYGCGAHSDTTMPTGAGSPIYEAYDDASVEVVPAEEIGSRRPATATPGDAPPEVSANRAAGARESAEAAGAPDPARATDGVTDISVPAGTTHSADLPDSGAAPAGTPETVAGVPADDSGEPGPAEPVSAPIAPEAVVAEQPVSARTEPPATESAPDNRAAEPEATGTAPGEAGNAASGEHAAAAETGDTEDGSPGEPAAGA